MIGGLKTTSRLALVAAAGLFASTMGASAADLGGNCCADLEERVAELEATTVRKGNRKVSVTLSGFVAHNVMYWDDGHDSNVYIGDGGNYGSRFRFVGKAKISANVSAGFLYEFGINNNALGSMTQGLGGDDLGGAVSLRDSTVWLAHKQLGKIKIGHGSTATDNLILIDLGNKSGAATPDIALYNGSFVARSSTGAFSVGDWNAWIRGRESFDTTRRNHVMYETPTLAGFSIQAAIAEDDFWDVALRYAGEFGGIRVAFGVGYLEDTEFANNGKRTDLKGSASVLHVPTGLFVTAAAGHREESNLSGWVGSAPDAHFWYVSGGLSKNYTGIGATVLYGEYFEGKNFIEQVGLNVGANDTVSMWGIGITQHVDAAAMEVYVAYKSYSIDCAGGPCFANGYSDFQAVLAGTRINF